MTIERMYDAHYYATSCGQPYQRNAEWLGVFDHIAHHIATNIAPKTVMDAGCAMGFLVEQLRKHDVEAYGVDISEYAIEQVYEPIKPFCAVGSIATPFPQTYDLIVSIEVVEHMPKAEAEEAIANMCRHTDDILFSSTPFDYEEATHINVQMPEYWAEQFARHGFVRDVDFDASFITVWAVRFRRSINPPSRIIRDYERRFWALWKENIDLRRLNQTNEHQIRDIRQHLETQQLQAEQAHQLHETKLLHLAQLKQEHDLQLKQLAQQRDYYAHQWRSLQHTIGWVMLQKMQELRAKLSPPNSARDDMLEEFFQLIVRYRLTSALKIMLARIRSKQPKQQIAHEQIAPPNRFDPAYHAWMKQYEPQANDIASQRTHQQSFTHRPLISYITPVYNPPPKVLQAMIESVLAQTYPEWELCLVDGGSIDPCLRDIMEQFAAQDSRIKLKYLVENLGISGNSNEALKMATGEFIAILDHDDLVPPNMLFEVVSLFNQHPEADIIYFDEDKITEHDNIRYEPWFKPDWSPELLISCNLLMHSLFRRRLVEQIGGFDPATDGAQDWDLAFRCSELTAHIYHIPKILYHWRTVEASAAFDVSAKPWAFEAQNRALRTHLDRQDGQQAQIYRPNIHTPPRILWPTTGRKVSIIIPTKNNPELLFACLSSIIGYTEYDNYEFVILDNNSTNPILEPYYQLLRQDPRIKIVDNPGRFNYSVANNLGAQHATGDILLFLNNDTEVRDPKWLTDMVGWVERAEIGIVGPRLVRPDGTVQHMGIVMGLCGHGSHLFDGIDATSHFYSLVGSTAWYRNISAVTGACLMVRREVFERVGGFDEAYILGFSDIEFCLRVREAGYRILYNAEVSLIHHEGGSRGMYNPMCDILRASLQLLPYVQQHDPYYSPNLSYARIFPHYLRPDDESRIDRLDRIMRTFKLIDREHQVDISLDTLRDTVLDDLHPLLPNARPSKPKRFMFVTHELSLTGAPFTLVRLAEYAHKQGLDVTVFSPNDGPLREYCEAAKLPLQIVPYLLKDARLTTQHLHDFDCILANTIFTYRAIHVARALSKRSVWWIHESLAGYHTLLENKQATHALNIADAVVFPASYAAQQYQSLMPHAEQHVIRLGVNATDFPNRPPRPVHGNLKLTYVASLEHRKGQDVLLKAIPLLPRPYQQRLEVEFVGGTLEAKYAESLSFLPTGAATVTFRGQLPRAEALDAMAQADLLVLTSRDEVLPGTILEAFALGTPVLATRVGGVAEAVTHGHDGLLVEADNPQAIAISLMRLIMDADFVDRLGKNAQTTYAERFTFDRFGAQMLDVLRGGHQVAESVCDAP